MSSKKMTDQEAARLRQLLSEHDSGQKPLTTIDLNNPPKQPYGFQKFPKMLYDHAASDPAHEEERLGKNGAVETIHIKAKMVTVLVHSEEQLAEALANGWSETAPEYREDREEPLSAHYENEAARIDSQIASTRRGPGRPSKAELAARQ